MRPSTRAVSFIDSFWQMCEPVAPMYVTCAPWSYAATSKAERVRVESFSNSERDRLALEAPLLAAVALRRLELGRELEHVQQLVAREVRERQEVPAGQLGHGLIFVARARACRRRSKPPPAEPSLNGVLSRVVPVHDQRPEDHHRQEEHGECPQRVLRAADEAELLEEREAADDDREPARPARAAEQPEAGEADDDPPEERDPAPGREVEDRRSGSASPRSTRRG